MARLIGYICGLSVLLMGIMLGGEVHLFIDWPSLAITVGGGFAFCFAVHSPAELNRALSLANGADSVSEDDFQRHDAVLETLSNTFIAAGVAGSLIGMVNMLANMDDPKSIGPACAVSILTILYAALLSGLLVTPMRGRLRGRVEGGGKRPKSPSAILPASLFFMIMTLIIILPSEFAS